MSDKAQQLFCAELLLLGGGASRHDIEMDEQEKHKTRQVPKSYQPEQQTETLVRQTINKEKVFGFFCSFSPDFVSSEAETGDTKRRQHKFMPFSLIPSRLRNENAHEIEPERFWLVHHAQHVFSFVRLLLPFPKRHKQKISICVFVCAFLVSSSLSIFFLHYIITISRLKIAFFLIRVDFCCFARLAFTASLAPTVTRWEGRKVSGYADQFIDFPIF